MVDAWPTTRPAAPLWRLRKITAADFDWAFELHKAAMGEYVDQMWGWEEDFQRQFFADRFESKPRQVIHIAGEDVGVVEIEERPDELYLGLIELLPAWQGRGLGTDIIRSLIRRAADAGKPLSLHVLKTNQRATALYQREGLRVVDSEEAKLLMRTSPADAQTAPPTDSRSRTAQRPCSREGPRSCAIIRGCPARPNGRKRSKR